MDDMFNILLKIQQSFIIFNIKKNFYKHSEQWYVRWMHNYTIANTLLKIHLVYSVYSGKLLQITDQM